MLSRSRGGRWFLRGSLALTLGLSSRGAHAGACPAPEGGAPLAAVDAQARLDFLAAAFDREVRTVDTWSWTWGSIYTAGAVAEGVGLGLSHDHGTRTDLTVGVIATGFGALSLYGLPLKLTLPLRSARSRWGEPDACAVLAEAERTLVSVESNQALATGIVPHLGNVAVNVGLALLLGLGYGRWTSAAISGGVGLTIGETNAFTQPHHLKDALARYRAGELTDAPPHAPAVSWALTPVVSRELTGLRLHLTW